MSLPLAWRKDEIPLRAVKHPLYALLSESLAIEFIQASRTVKAAAKLLRLSWSSVQTIMARAVERGLERRDAGPIVHLGIYKKSFREGQDYVTVLTDIDGSRVVDLLQVGQIKLQNSFFTVPLTSSVEV